MKGSAGNLGAMVLQECASELEQAAQRGEDTDALASLADAVRAEYARVERYLQQIVAQRRRNTAGGSGR